MELETINRLYLELSQFATAKTAREIALEKQVAELQATVPEGMVMDAARYQWLKASKPIHDGAPFIARNFGASFSMWTGEDADRVIDEAIAAAKVKP